MKQVLRGTYSSSSTCLYEMLDDALTTNVNCTNHNLNMTGLALHTLLYRFRKIMHVSDVAYVLEFAPTYQTLFSCSEPLHWNGAVSRRSVNYEMPWDYYLPFILLFVHFTCAILFKNISGTVKIHFHLLCSSPFFPLFDLSLNLLHRHLLPWESP